MMNKNQILKVGGIKNNIWTQVENNIFTDVYNVQFINRYNNYLVLYLVISSSCVWRLNSVLVGMTRIIKRI